MCTSICVRGFWDVTDMHVWSVLGYGEESGKFLR